MRLAVSIDLVLHFRLCSCFSSDLQVRDCSETLQFWDAVCHVRGSLGSFPDSRRASPVLCLDYLLADAQIQGY